MSKGRGKSGATGGRMRAVPLMLAGLALSACTEGPASLLTTPAQLQERTPFTQVAPTQSWINAPGIVLVMQRGLRGESQQRVALANQTGVPGDNVIVMRAQSLSGRPGRFGYEDFMSRIGGAPAPFADVSSGDLITAEDEVGPYFWAEERFGDDTICVLGIRRITSSQRLLPGTASVLDIMLRNCVQGEAEEALGPLMSGSVSAPPVTGAVVGESRVISPLAAPAVR